MSAIVSEQPRRIKWQVVGSPVAVLALLLYVEIVAIMRHGFEYPSILLGWAFVGGCVACLAIPFFVMPKKVEANESGIRVRYFTGRERAYRWEDLRAVELVERSRFQESPESVLRLKPMKGRNVTVTYLMTNFEPFMHFSLARRT